MHVFIIIECNYVPTRVDYSLSKSKYVYKMEMISDKFIVENHKCLSEKSAKFTSYWNSKGNLHKGIAYYGVSIFEPEMIHEFLVSLNEILDCSEKASLVRLCNVAINNKMYLIHFGI